MRWQKDVVGRRQRKGGGRKEVTGRRWQKGGSSSLFRTFSAHFSKGLAALQGLVKVTKMLALLQLLLSLLQQFLCIFFGLLDQFGWIFPYPVSHFGWWKLIFEDILAGQLKLAAKISNWLGKRSHCSHLSGAFVYNIGWLKTLFPTKSANWADLVQQL